MNAKLEGEDARLLSLMRSFTDVLRLREHQGVTSRRNGATPLPPSQQRHCRAAFLVLAVCGLTCGNAVAEFHVWRGANGHKHVSTVPVRGYRPDRTLRPGYDPNSIVYQHRRLRERLHLLDRQLEHEAAIAQREASADHSDQSPPVRRAPREGVMNLDELIALEKRGGRWIGAEEAHGGATRTK